MIATKSKPGSRRFAQRRWIYDELLAELPETNQPSELWDGEKDGQYRLLGRWRPGETAQSKLLPSFTVSVDELFKTEK